jgi:23S rRNA pseudouridine1911/1915/1917 synthase
MIGGPATGEDAAASPPEHLRVGASQVGLRVDAFLFAALPFVSRTRIRQKIQLGETLLNGRRYASSARLSEGDEIIVFWRGAPDRTPAPPLQVLYEDDVLLAIDKPAGVACHPMGMIQSGTVIQSAREREETRIRARLAEGDTSWFPRLVNRLDVFTSGIVLIARDRETLVVMQALTAQKSTVKDYVALVEGVVAEEEGRIDLPLRLDPDGPVRVKMIVRPDGLPSTTEWRVRQRLREHTLLSVRLRSGRQHQIRAHLAAIGHPILGDLLYKDETLFLRYQEKGASRGTHGTDGPVLPTPAPALPQRHCLHAERLGFPHPLTGEGVVIEAPFPQDFLDILARCEQSGRLH